MRRRDLLDVGELKARTGGQNGDRCPGAKKRIRFFPRLPDEYRVQLSGALSRRDFQRREIAISLTAGEVVEATNGSRVAERLGKPRC